MMAVVDFPPGPTVNQIFQAANGATYRWTGVYWQSVGMGSAIGIGDIPPATPISGQLWFNTALGALFIWFDDGSSAQWVPANPMPVMPTGTGILQTVSFQTGAVATGTTTMSLSDSIPQITQGNEYMTLAITPLLITSRLVINVTFTGAHNTFNNIIVALFRDSTANALAAVPSNYANVSNDLRSLRFTHTTASVSLSPTTFRVRAGGSAAGTLTFNGVGGVRSLGGVMASSIVIQEVL